MTALVGLRSTHVEDASRLLAAVTTEPALVYGTSLGGLIALGLAAGHPEQVDVVVAHEPGATNLLPEPERTAALQGLLAVEETFAAAGADAALGLFAERFDIDPSDSEPDVELNPPSPQQRANFEFFAAHDLPALRKHVLDLDALRDSPARLVPVVGASSGRLWPNACGRLLAESLGLVCETFPGGHNGYVFRPRQTAERLREVLGAR